MKSGLHASPRGAAAVVFGQRYIVIVVKSIRSRVHQEGIVLWIVLWVVGVPLIIVFVAFGGFKLVRSRSALRAAGMHWVERTRPMTPRVVGAIEVICAVALAVALLLRLPALSVGASAVLLVAMAIAAVVQVRARASLVPPAVMGALAAVSCAVGTLVLVRF